MRPFLRPLPRFLSRRTHVASVACGVKYGVAANCELCVVKVMGQGGGGSIGNVIRGIDFVVADCGASLCVLNLSLRAGGNSGALNRAVTNAAAAGVVVVVAAGNDREDACEYSPARVPGTWSSLLWAKIALEKKLLKKSNKCPRMCGVGAEHAHWNNARCRLQHRTLHQDSCLGFCSAKMK